MMTTLSRRQLLATASGVGAAAVLSATAAHATEKRSTPVSDVPLNVGNLERVTQTLVPPPFLPDHDQIASGGPKVVQVRLVVEEKASTVGNPRESRISRASRWTMALDDIVYLTLG